MCAPALRKIELNSGAAGPRDLDGYELASRLSYFIWSSTPDQELYSAAASGTLADSGALSAQVTRLLADGKAAALAERFGSQWLNLRSLENVHPDAPELVRHRPGWAEGRRTHRPRRQALDQISEAETGAAGCRGVEDVENPDGLGRHDR